MKKSMYCFILTAGMCLISVSGLSAVSTQTEGEPTFASWNFTERYKESFDEYTGDIAVLTDNGWTLSRNDALTVRESSVSFDWNRWVQYEQAQGSGDVYYRYKIQMYNNTENAQLVSLIGESGNSYTVVASPNANGATYEFTTVVSQENAMAYTYNYQGELIGSVSIVKDTIKGIKFENTINTNTSNGFWIYDFYSGVITYDDGEESTETPTESPTPNVTPNAPKYSEWKFEADYTEGFDYDSSVMSDAEMRQDLISKGWTTTDRDDALTMRTSAVSFNWNRFAQYNGFKDDVFYYRYKIQMYNENENSQLVKLIGTNEYVAIASPKAFGATHEFITVIDTENAVVYTYSYKGDIVSVINIGEDTIKSIKFENTVNSNSSNSFWIYDLEFGTASKSEINDTYSATVEMSGTTTNVSVQMPDTIDDKAVMYIAFYNSDGKLLGTYIEKDIKDKNAYTTIEGTVSAKAFIWDDVMKPLI